MKLLSNLSRRVPFLVLLVTLGVTVISRHWPEAAILAVGVLFIAAKKLRPRSRENSPQIQLQAFATGFLQVQDHARTLYSASESLRTVVGEENSAVTKSSSALEEISSMLGKTTQGAGQLADMASSAKQSVTSGKEAVNEVVSRLEVIQNGTNRLNDSLRGNLVNLEKVIGSLSEIRSKTEVINDIVFQTKLLSFNASVEAARAGEHGKGFAVVADEMGKLAISSGKGSAEISSILKNNLESTHTIIEQMKKELTDLMSQAAGDVARGIESGTRGTEAFNTIVSRVDTVSSLSADISQATREQEIGVREITEAIHQLQSTSNQLASVATATLKSALGLSDQTEKQGNDLRAFGQSINIPITFPTPPFDFDAAVKAHIDWKMKLSKYLTTPDHSLDPKKVCLDNACALGKWIYGDGTTYSRHIEYENLRKTHATFHQTASEIITAIHSGKELEAKRVLASGGRYAQVSDRCVELIQALKRLAATESAKENRAA